jgi:hypothetical protein
MSKAPKLPSGSPFEVICKHCGATAKSWHYTDKHIPAGEERGLVYCKCGRTGADSMGVKGMGRVIERSDHET